MVVIHQRQKFPLLELLVVVACISILSALLVRAVQRARPRGGGHWCQWNLKNLYMSLQVYMLDSEDALPLANCEAGASGSNWYQVLVTKGYLSDESVFVCPSDPSPETFNTGPSMDPRKGGVPYRGIHPDCYYYDADAQMYRRGDGRPHVDKFFPLGGSYGLNRELGGHKLKDVMFPKWMPFVTDSVHPSFEDGTQVTAPPGAPTIMPRNGPFAGPHNARWHGGSELPYVKEDVSPDARSDQRLQGGNNVLFLDGHVEFVCGNALGNRARKCDTDPTKIPGANPFETDPTAPDCGEDVD